MSEPKQPEPPYVRSAAIAEAANEVRVEPDVAPARMPGGEPAQRAALGRTPEERAEPPLRADLV